MQSELLNQFCVDIWLCYGSFSYGFESNIHSWEDFSLLLTPKSHDKSEAEELFSFFDGVIEKPKGLLRVELRVFGPEKTYKQHKIEGPVYLFTDIVPKLIDHEVLLPLLHFKSLRGISSSNTENWNKLVRQIWNQTSQKPPRKR